MLLSDEKILIAAAAAFNIDQTSHVEEYPRMNELELINQPTIFEVPTKLKNVKPDACYVAETKEEVLLVFRFTALPPNGLIELIKDWKNNLQRELIPQEGYPGLVHKGFIKSVNDLDKKGFMADVLTRVKDKRVVVTGISKGGALAPLSCIKLIQQGIDPSKIKIRIFASPKCGNLEFSQKFNQSFPHCIRYEYGNDVIPHYPFNDVFKVKVIPKLNALLRNILEGQDAKLPGSSDYHHVGVLKYIVNSGDDSYAQVDEDESLLYSNRCDILAKKVQRELDFIILTDHSHIPFLHFLEDKDS